MCRATIGRIFLVGDDLRLIVQLQAGRAEVVAQLVADHQLRPAEPQPQAGQQPAVHSLCLNQGDALLAIHNVQRLPLQNDSGADAVVYSVQLKTTQIEPLLVAGAVLAFDHLAHPLATRIVHVVSRAAAP